MMRVLSLPQLYCEECHVPLIQEFKGDDLLIEHPSNLTCGQKDRRVYVPLKEFRKELS